MGWYCDSSRQSCADRREDLEDGIPTYGEDVIDRSVASRRWTIWPQAAVTAFAGPCVEP